MRGVAKDFNSLLELSLHGSISEVHVWGNLAEQPR